jgi:hypothetical protein
VVERWILWSYLLGQVFATKAYCQFHSCSLYVFANFQTKTQEITNNLTAGTVGGFIGTALNTPCKSYLYAPDKADV